LYDESVIVIPEQGAAALHWNFATVLPDKVPVTLLILISMMANLELLQLPFTPLTKEVH